MLKMDNIGLETVQNFPKTSGNGVVSITVRKGRALPLGIVDTTDLNLLNRGCFHCVLRPRRVLPACKNRDGVTLPRQLLGKSGRVGFGPSQIFRWQAVDDLDNTHFL